MSDKDKAGKLVEGIPIVGDPDEAQQGLTYLVSALCIKNPVMEAVVPLNGFKGEAVIKWTAAPVPQRLVDTAVGFFRAVHRKHKTEAGVMGLYHPGRKRWQLQCPKQECGGASCNMDLKSIDRPDGWLLCMSMHSHPDMGAFHSGTDTSDEAEFDGLHITVGHVEAVPEFDAEVTCRGYRLKVKMDEVTVREQVGAPRGWLDRVTEPHRPVVEFDNRGFLSDWWWGSCGRSRGRGKWKGPSSATVPHGEQGSLIIDGECGLAGNRALMDNVDRRFSAECSYGSCTELSTMRDIELGMWFCKDHFEQMNRLSKEGGVSRT